MTGKMRALSKLEPKPGLKLTYTGIPSIGPDEILVEIKTVSVCGTDVHIYEWDEWARSIVKPPLIIGHEFAGKVIDAGKNVTEFNVGDLVSGETHIWCGKCYNCRTGNAHLCSNLLIRGVNVNGCFAEFHAVDCKTAWKNPGNLKPEVATIQEPLGNAMHAVSQVEVRGKSVAIFGCGPIGLCTIALCSAFGSYLTIAVDISEYRLNLAKKMGSKVTINGKESDVEEEIMDLTDGKGVDVFFEMSGAPIVYRQGLNVLRPGGVAILFGLPPKPVEIDVTNLVILKGITAKGIYGRRIFETWYDTSKILETNMVDLEKIITHKLSLEDFEEAFDLMRAGKCGKVVMYP